MLVLKEKLPPTDSRLRPDQKHLESGEYDAANSEKLRLEQKQRRVSVAIFLFLLISEYSVVLNCYLSTYYAETLMVSTYVHFHHDICREISWQLI